MIIKPVSGKLNLLPAITCGLFLLATFILIDGCGSTSLYNMWKDPAFESPPLTNILVIGIRQDPLRRRVWEDGFVEELQKHGIKATPSYRLYTNTLPDTIQITEAVKAYSFDGILINHSLHPEQDVHLVPGYVAEERVRRYDPISRHYDTYYRQVQHPSVADTVKISRYEIDVWCTSNPEKLVWSGVTKTTDPATIREVQQEVVGIVVPELANMAIIPPLR